MVANCTWLNLCASVTTVVSQKWCGGYPAEISRRTTGATQISISQTKVTVEKQKRKTTMTSQIDQSDRTYVQSSRAQEGNTL